jgi:hypothetical protein
MRVDRESTSGSLSLGEWEEGEGAAADIAVFCWQSQTTLRSRRLLRCFAQWGAQVQWPCNTQHGLLLRRNATGIMLCDVVIKTRGEMDGA